MEARVNATTDQNAIFDEVDVTTLQFDATGTMEKLLASLHVLL